MNLSIIAVTNNITLSLGKETIVVNKEKSPELFKEIMDLLEKDQVKSTEWLTSNFKSIKDQIEAKTNGVFSVENGVIVLKGSTIPVPATIIKKLKELEGSKKSILPLIRFWKKLALNPSKSAREDLFDFMDKNNIPLTETGDIVTEKGVNQVKNSYFGHLVDVHSGTVDNSIGMQVVMPREKVNADSNQTCSSGLHVAAPDYVRKNWSSDVIVECIVNPIDVVSVPKDYNATKMRVCAYYVAGYSQKNNRAGDKIVTLADFMNVPSEEAVAKMIAKAEKVEDVVITESVEKDKVVEVKKPVTFPKNKDNVISKKKDPVTNKSKVDLSSMSAKNIIEYVKKETGEEIKIGLKSKKAILKKANLILSQSDESATKSVAKELINIPLDETESNCIVESTEKEKEASLVVEKVVNLKTMSRTQLTDFAKEKFNETFSFITSTATILTKVTKLAESAGYKIEE